MPASVGNLRGQLHADTGMFNRFMTMTDARLVLPNGTAIDVPVLFVNRDLVAAMTSPVESSVLAPMS
jgi:hypothetical protein